MADKPTHTAYQVRNFKSGGEDKSSWTRIGSAWAYPDGEGFNIRLHATPNDGNIFLRTAKEKKQTEEGDESYYLFFPLFVYFSAWRQRSIKKQFGSWAGYAWPCSRLLR